jgi:hypothetical protein
MSTFVEIEKLESARRHLEAGVLLFFERKDPLVVYSVAFTAYQVLSEICQQKGIERTLEDSPELQQLGVREEAIRAFKTPRNFFQHGQRGTGRVKFFPDIVPLLLLLAEDLHSKLVGEATFAGKVMRIWFAVKYPGRVEPALRVPLATLPTVPTSDDYEVFLELLREHSPQS